MLKYLYYINNISINIVTSYLRFHVKYNFIKNDINIKNIKSLLIKNSVI